MKEWLTAGTAIGRYRISSRLSADGVGEVYLANEVSSGLEVALKLLPAALTSDHQARQRFIQIFSSIAQLRHPNFCRVYEGGIAEDGRPFIAMEYAKGRSLDLMRFGPRQPVARIVSLVIQIAEALDELHARGWFHLAIKPSNLMTTAAGQAKILDFGIGLAFPPSFSSDVDGALRATPGSARYLSPEQIAGEKPDQRSDVFSLGVTLHELIAGSPPFAGSTIDQVVASVTLAPPPPLTELRADAPAELNRVAARAMAKDPAARYQTMGEMARDLREIGELRRQSKFFAPARKNKSAANADEQGDGGEKVPPESFIDELKRFINRLFEDSEKKGIAKAEKIELIRERSFLEDLIYFVKTYRYKLVAALLTIIGVFIAVFAVAQFSGGEPEPAAEERLAPRVARITENGRVTDAAIAPDGATLVYASQEGAEQTLWLKDLKSGKETRLASVSGREYRGLSFSPDGRSALYVKAALDDDAGEACELAVSSGAEKVLFAGCGAFAASPDGKRFAVIGANGDGSGTVLSINAANNAARTLATRRNPGRFYAVNPAWSPDGSLIACAVKDESSDLFVEIVTIAVADGAEQTVATGRWSEVNRMSWLADGNDLVVAASDPVSNLSRLWRVAYPSGDVSPVAPITKDSFGYGGVSLTRGDPRLVSVQRRVVSNVWVASNVEGDQLSQVTADGFDGINGLEWTPNGRIVYSSRAGGSETIWMSNRADKLKIGEQRPLPIAPYGSDGRQSHPSISPSGREIVFVAENSTGAYLWRGEIARRNLKTLGDDRIALFPQFSPDGRWIAYSALRDGRAMIARIAAGGGKLETLIGNRAWRPVVSPDGTRLACNYFDDEKARWKIAIFALPGSNPISTFDAPGAMNRVLRWTPDGTGVAYVAGSGGAPGIRIQPLAGGQSAQALNSRNDHIFNFAWSRDGKRVAFARGAALSDVVLMQNFR